MEDTGDGAHALGTRLSPTPGISLSVVDLQLTATTTGAPVQAAPGTSCAEVILQNDPASTQPVQVSGTDVSNGVTLAPGELRAFVTINSALLSVHTATGTATVNALIRVASGSAASLTTTAAALASAPAAEVLLRAAPTNTTNVLVGGADGQYLVLLPGQLLRLAVTNADVLSAKMASGTGTVYVQARN